MEGYLYHFNCSKWYGSRTGLKNIFIDQKTRSDESIEKIIEADARKTSGSDTCDVQLLQKFSIHIQPVTTYSSIVDNTLPGLNNLKFAHPQKT